MAVQTHYLKTWPEHFIFVDADIKKVECRMDDREFKVGDFLCLREWEPSTKVYTGRVCWRYVTHILPGGNFGLKRGYVAMSIVPAPETHVNLFLMPENNVTPQTLNKKTIWQKRKGIMPVDIRQYKIVEVRGTNPTAARVFICTLSGKNPLTVPYKKFIQNYVAVGFID